MILRGYGDDQVIVVRGFTRTLLEKVLVEAIALIRGGSKARKKLRKKLDEELYEPAKKIVVTAMLIAINSEEVTHPRSQKQTKTIPSSGDTIVEISGGRVKYMKMPFREIFINAIKVISKRRK